MKIKYKVDKENKTVIAYAQDGKQAWENMITNLEIKIEDQSYFLISADLCRKARKYALSDMKLFGQSKCHPDDVFDEKVGIELARKKFLNKVSRVKSKYLDVIHKELEKTDLFVDELQLNLPWGN